MRGGAGSITGCVVHSYLKLLSETLAEATSCNGALAQNRASICLYGSVDVRGEKLYVDDISFGDSF